MYGRFPRTLATLEADSLSRALVALPIVLAVLAAWGGWFFGSTLGVYAVSDEARLEVAESVQPVEAPVDGRVVAVIGSLEREVEEGDLLVELDNEDQLLQLEEEKTRRDAASAQIEALRIEIGASAATVKQQLRAARLALQEGRSKAEEAEAVASLAEVEAQKTAALQGAGQVPEIQLLRAQTEARRLRAGAETAQLAAARLRSELAAKQENRLTDRTRLERSLALLAGQLATSNATVARLEHELEQRNIRAPVSGRLGEWAKLGVGAVVRKGDRLGVVIPTAQVKVVAELTPAQAVGRVLPGQKGQLRLSGFPWTQFGSLPVVVSRVASEPRAGTIRVELLPTVAAPTLVPLEHGLPGSVEVEVERVSPATLVLRAVGHRLAGLARPPVSSTHPGASR